jgi:hypothetical protein
MVNHRNPVVEVVGAALVNPNDFINNRSATALVVCDADC